MIRKPRKINIEKGLPNKSGNDINKGEKNEGHLPNFPAYTNTDAVILLKSILCCKRCRMLLAQTVQKFSLLVSQMLT